MKLDLSGRLALVGGATSGIGWAVAKTFAQAGACVVIVARSENRLKARLEELRAISDAQHEAIMANYDNPNSISALIETLREKAIVPDIIVNNAGGPPPGALTEAERDEFHRALDRLIVASHQLVQYALPRMKAERWGRILSVISTSVRQPIEGLGVSNTVRQQLQPGQRRFRWNLLPMELPSTAFFPVQRGRSGSSRSSPPELQRGESSNVSSRRRCSGKFRSIVSPNLRKSQRSRSSSAQIWPDTLPGNAYELMVGELVASKCKAATEVLSPHPAVAGAGLEPATFGL